MHPIGQILNYDERREFQNRGTEHIHAPIHIKGAPIIDEDDDSNDNEVVDFVDKYITCSLPDEGFFPDLYELVKKLQTHRHKNTCKKKKSVTCRFNAPWPPSIKTRIVRGGKDIEKDVLKENKKILDKVLLQVAQMEMENICDITIEELLAVCDVSDDEFEEAVENMQKKLSIIYKRRPCEANIGPYNTVILSLLRANMNLQYVTGVHGLLVYLSMQT